MMIGVPTATVTINTDIMTIRAPVITVIVTTNIDITMIRVLAVAVMVIIIINTDTMTTTMKMKAHPTLRLPPNRHQRIKVTIIKA